MEPTFVDYDQLPTLPSRPTSSLASTPSNSDESLLSLDIEYVRYRKPNLYARLLAKYPWAIALFSFSLGSVCVILSATVIPFPDFNDPTKGFNAHGTDISVKSTAFNNLMNQVYSGDKLKPQPTRLQASARVKRRALVKSCGMQIINPDVYKIVFESTSSDTDLFNLRSFQSICDIETIIIRPSFNRVVGKHNDSDCPYMISMPLYTMMLQRKTSCSLLTNEDITAMKNLLAYCYPYYKQGYLAACFSQSHSCVAPPNCTKYGIMYKSFYYLLDVDYDPTQSNAKLRYNMLIYNSQVPDPTEYFRETFTDRSIIHGSVKITAVYAEMNTKFDVFQEYFIEDMWKYIVGIALSSILVILLLYLWSVVLLIATALTVGFSFAMAYVIYFYILQVKSFPFLNILAALILIAIGADDVFIFFDAWKLAKKEDSQISLENRVARTFSHAAMSILVTSLTTAGSFFSNYLTKIVSIRCFALFAGVSVLANLFFMVTWIPAVIVCQSKCVDCFKKHVRLPSAPLVYKIFIEKRMQLSNYIFGNVISRIVENCWHVCIVVFLSVGIAGMFIVFYKPRLQAPQSAQFSLFPKDHLFEKWDNGIREHFEYFKIQVPSNVWFVWGIHPQENGYWYNDHDLGTLKFDDNFDLFSQKSQSWFNTLCNATINSDLFTVRKHPKSKYVSMFEAFEEVLSDCDHNQFDVFCCKTRKMPFPQSYLKKCFAPLWEKARFDQLATTVIFNKHNEVKAMYIKLSTLQQFSMSFNKMNDLYHNISNYFNAHLAHAPNGMDNGFWTSIIDYRPFDITLFGFYDLQRVLSTGTHYSIILSLSVAAVLMFLTSLNLLLTIYAMITITLAISVTIGCLVLMGWHLNIVESMTISLAVGMSIDFTIHYGISYRLSKERESMFRTRESFERVGSAVVMAAFTTFVAGCAMMPSHILAYLQLGKFLMLVMTFSWLYATFFFQSLCHIIGPRGNFCQVPLPCVKRSQNNDNLNGYEPYRVLQLTDPTLILGEMNENLDSSDDTYLLPT